MQRERVQWFMNGAAPKFLEALERFVRCNYSYAFLRTCHFWANGSFDKKRGRDISDFSLLHEPWELNFSF